MPCPYAGIWEDNIDKIKTALVLANAEINKLANAEINKLANAEINKLTLTLTF
jgi:hypothetical protein